MKTLYFASANRAKTREISDLLKEFALVKDLNDVKVPVTWEETGSTFEENALIKVDALWRLMPGDLFAEDSGLCVPALGGAPGVLSARWSGKNGDDFANNKKLLLEMSGLSSKSRQAYFITSLVYRNSKKEDFFFQGQMNGSLLMEARGAQGFGYDPLFVPDGYNKTLGELSMEEKNKISHRAQAVLNFKVFLKSLSW